MGAEMCYAAAGSNIAVMAAFLRSGVDANTADYDGRTGLHLASAQGNKEMVALLLAYGRRGLSLTLRGMNVSVKGASPKSLDRFGFTPLDDARRTGGEVIVPTGLQTTVTVHCRRW